ncbi:phage Gp37/Gp68 family protein [Chelatococcus sp. XZ-Ab1]|uniref:phage Gp37/Gp68 family protein n=1 Tax=Chelatococcus sp. XZ-Ab1 TaxID=3034027 RepID=UPI0023E45071|nr:phage Gp37/Gp68 family protein [Chelatococcus sp. XZ-Ab1]
MASNTKIEWAHHTFNPWVGCTAVSPACDHCYAESWAKRTGQAHLWKGDRRRTSEANWRLPLKWNRQAEAAGIRFRVFCASLADVFDNQVPQIWRSDLFALIEDTPHLDWLLLTKRPQNIQKMIWPKWDAGLTRNIWLGTTAEDQHEANRRIPHLLEAPAAVRFVSAEPLLGAIDFEPWLDRIDWVIVGGESGAGARPMHPHWARSIRDQCEAAGTAFFFKQWGAWVPHRPWTAETITVWPDGSVGAGNANENGGGGCDMRKVAKNAAGRFLDGREHNAMPEARVAVYGFRPVLANIDAMEG